MKAARYLAAWCLLLVGAADRQARAEEVRPLEFVHALQEKNYHEVAVDYLKMLKQLPQMPAELAQVWDLEMSKSLRGAANQAFNREEYERLMAEAQKHLDAFLKTKPDHSEAVTAMVSWAGLSMDQALKLLREAKGLADKDPGQRAKKLAEARAALEEARPRFQQAAEKFQVMLNTLPDVPVPQTKRGPKLDKSAKAALAEREQVKAELLNAQFQSALVDYYAAQTYEDRRAEARKAALFRSARGFDDIYQRNRVDAQNQVSVVGLAAHMWHGKAVDELGDYQLARDIYEEVLANELDPKVQDKVLDPLFAQVKQYWLAIIARENVDQFLQEATQWLKENAKKSRRYEGYQGIALEVAKTLLKLAEQSPGPEKARLTGEAMTLLAGMTNIPSPYQQDAFALRRQYGKGGVATEVTEAKTFDEAVDLANAAAESGNWQQAANGYAKALELGGGAKNETRLKAVQDALGNARLMVATELLRQNKFEECMKAVKAVIREQKESLAAPAASALAASAALGLYAAVPPGEPLKKQEALNQLQQIVSFTETTWPGRPEADDARMVLGKASLLERNFDEAIGVFEKVNSKSDRYPVALFLEAYAYWQRYQLGKRGEENRDKEKVAADRAKAVDLATASLVELKKPERAKTAARHQQDTLLLLADIALEGDQPKDAVSYVQPLMDQARAARSDPNDASAFRVFYTATRAYLAAGQTDRASEAGMALADLGADVAPVNIVLVEFAKSLDVERKRADGELTKATSAGDAQAVEAAKAKLASAQKMMGSLLKKLAARKQHTLGGLMAIADLCNASGLSAEANQQYKTILAIPNVDKKAATRARAQLVGLLRKEGKFDEAYAEVKQLIQDNPNALEPQGELGRILQSWAEKDPRHYDEAVSQWVRVRNWLQPMRKKPPEYYEVIHNAAFCLFMQAQRSGQKAEEKYLDAYKLLKSASVLNPSLSGPDMVAKYKALFEKLDAAMRPPSTRAGKR